MAGEWEDTGTRDGLIRGVIFDLDGTLVTQVLDFDAIRREIGLPTGTPVLEGLDGLSAAERDAAYAILRRHEATAAALAILNPGVKAFLDWLDSCSVRRGVFSRNSRESVSFVLDRCGLHFDTVVCREDAPYKPQPEGIWQICEAWQLAPSEVLMVGDYLYDIEAGKRAGLRTALVTHSRELPFAGQADVLLASFDTIIPGVLRKWIVGTADASTAADLPSRQSPRVI